MGATLEIVNLKTGYRHSAVVSDSLTASIEAGQMTCLLGPNGAGKSTLLRTLAAFQPMLGGEIRVMGRSIKDFSARELACTIGVVLTDKPLLDGMTVHEVVAMGRSPYTGFWDRLSADDRRIVDESIEMTGIAGLARRQMNTLSDGERQKVMIAKAVAQQTPLIFLDEPTAYLDYPSKVQTMLLMRRLAHEMGKTVFMSVHDLELALQLADCIWLLDSKLGFVSGTPQSLSEKGYVERFFSSEGLSYDRNSRHFSVD